MKKEYKFFASLALAALIGILWINYKSDTIDEQKASSMTMIQNLSATLKSADKCWTEKNIGITDCASAENNLKKITDDQRTYFISNQGFIGVDYQHKNIIILTPEIAGRSLTWKCFGHPDKSLPKSCSAIESNIEK